MAPILRKLLAGAALLLAAPVVADVDPQANNPGVMEIISGAKEMREVAMKWYRTGTTEFRFVRFEVLSFQITSNSNFAQHININISILRSYSGVRNSKFIEYIAGWKTVPTNCDQKMGPQIRTLWLLSNLAPTG